MKYSGKVEEKVFKILMVIATYSILAILALIIFSIFAKGIKALSWEILTQVPKGGYYYGKGGGILNAILGSLSLAFGATFLAFIIGLPVALYINVFLVRQKKMVTLIRFILDLVWGIPSIVYGAFGFSMMILLGHPDLTAGRDAHSDLVHLADHDPINGRDLTDSADRAFRSCLLPGIQQIRIGI